MNIKNGSRCNRVDQLGKVGSRTLYACIFLPRPFYGCFSLSGLQNKRLKRDFRPYYACFLGQIMVVLISKLWFCIFSSDPRHIPTAFFRGQSIHAIPSTALKRHGLFQQPAWITAEERHCQPGGTVTFCFLQICSCLGMFAAAPLP